MIVSRVKEIEKHRNIPWWETYPKKELKVEVNFSETQVWITLGHTLSKGVKKQDQIQV